MDSRFFPGGGAFVCRLHLGLLDMELCQGRACRLPAEVIQEGVGLPDLGGRTGHGCGPRVDAREILLLRPGRWGGSADQPGHGPANGPVLRTARRCSHQLLRGNGILRQERESDRVGRNASTKPQADSTPGMMRPGTETQWGAAQPAIAISHPMIKRVRCAAATTKKIAPQTRKYVLGPIESLQSEGICSASADRFPLVLV